jgi:prephenate dehydrogenase
MIGGSFALGIRKNKLANQIWGLDVNREALDFGIKTRLIDDYILFSDKNKFDFKSIASFDLVIIACPISKYDIIFSKIIPKISNSKTIISELGSLKNFILKLKNTSDLIATHPIAGSQKIGVENSIPDLFVNKKIIFCKENLSEDNLKLKKITLMWQKLGANIVYLSAKEHDKIYALVSHLPQFLSFVIKENFSLNIDPNNKLLNTAYRLGDSSYQIWSDIFNLNQKNLEFFLKKLFKNIQILELQLDSHNELTWLNQIIDKFSLKEIDDSIKLKDIENNFDNFLLHVILITAFLKIAEIRKFNDYIGSGFKDFILPVAIFKKLSNQLDLTKLFTRNKISLLRKLQSLNAIITTFYAK